MKNSFLSVAGAAVALATLCAPTASHAADFQLAVKRLSVTQCTMAGSLLNIDSATGNVTIELGADFNCYPAAVNSIANNAALNVTSPTTVGGGATGQGSVDLVLNTGLSTMTPGVTCMPDGQLSNNVNVTSGWTNQLCGPNDCGPLVGRTVALQNPSPTTDGTITFRAKCSYQDQTNANLVTERKNILATPTVTVLHGTTPPVSFCQSVSELSNSYGLTPAMRQLTGTVSGGTLPGTGIDFTTYTAVFGTSPNTYPTGDPDNVGFGFPGTNRNNVQMGLERGKYISLQFRAPTGAIWNPEPPANKITGSYLIIPGNAFTLASVSPCPGQFSSDANYPNNLACHIVGKSQNLSFEITGGSTVRCKLIPGNTYYLNLIQAASSTDLTTPTCATSLCAPKVNLTGANPP